MGVVEVEVLVSSCRSHVRLCAGIGVVEVLLSSCSFELGLKWLKSY